MPKKKQRQDFMDLANAAGDIPTSALAASSEPARIRVEYEPLSELRRAPRNPKLHRLDLLDASMKRWGFTSPLLKDERTGLLVAGHGRLDELEVLRATGAEPPGRILVGENGEWMVPIIRGVGFKDEREAEAYLLADNRTSELGGWDDAGVTALLRDLAQEAVEGADPMLGVGFNLDDAAMIEADMASTKNGGEALDLHPSVVDSKKTYEVSTIRQVIFYFTTGDYEKTLGRLAQVMRATGVKNHTEALLHLLDHYENTASSEGAGVQPQDASADVSNA